MKDYMFYCFKNVAAVINRESCYEDVKETFSFSLNSFSRTIITHTEKEYEISKSPFCVSLKLQLHDPENLCLRATNLTKVET